MTHALKCWPEYFADIKNNVKCFELRKDDRPFNAGDDLIIQEYDPVKKQYTGYEEKRTISYLLRDAADFGLKKGFVILGLKEKEY